MDAIKKKMVALREETDRAVAKANASEAASEEANERADDWEEKQRKCQKKANEKQDLLDVRMEELIMADIKAEEKDKMFQLAELQRSQAERTIILKEEEVERAEERLGTNTTGMSCVSKDADKADKVRKELERENMAREDQIEQLENKHKVSSLPLSFFRNCLSPRAGGEVPCCGRREEVRGGCAQDEHDGARPGEGDDSGGQQRGQDRGQGARAQSHRG
jgi:hypothetical protein